MAIAPPASPYYSPRHRPQSLNESRSSAIPNVPILVAAFLSILATGGPTYSFGVYSATLKEDLSLTQGQLDTLGAASFAAGLISWVPGLFVDAWGSRLALIVGGLIQSIGLLGYWIVTRFAYALLPTGLLIPVLSSLSVVIFTSNNLVIGGVFKAIVVSCELGTKGKAVGAGKAYLGLGAGVFSCLFRALRQVWTKASDLDFLAMSACLAIGAIVFPAWLALPTRLAVEKRGTRDDSTATHYTVLYAGLFVLASVVVGSSASFLFRPLQEEGTTSFVNDQGEEEEDTTTNDGSTTRIVPEWLHGVLVLALWVGPVTGLLLLPTKESSKLNLKIYRRSQSAARRKIRKDMELDEAPPDERMRLVDFTSYSTEPSFEDEDNEPPCETPQQVTDLGLTEMLQTVPAWLFLGASTILVGSGTMLTINMGQMVQSLGFPPRAASACLAVFSVAQAMARVASGAISESALQWNTKIFGVSGVPRPAFLVLSCAFAVVGHFLLATSSDSRGIFVLGVVLTGISFGALWPLMVLIVGDLFGTVNHGANYMFFDGATCAIGTLSIAKFLTQMVYDKNIDDAVDATTCYGEECFRLTHMIISGLCLASLLACTVLLYITRGSYGTISDKG